MAHIVSDNCIRCKYTDCASICPVSAFHEASQFLVINPDECIDCALCVHACTAHAIYSEDDLPENQQAFVELNRRLSSELPLILGKQAPLPDADKWNGRKNKLQQLDLG